MNEERRHHGNHGPYFPREGGHDGSLADLLDSCGHYFAHRIGGSRRGQGSVLSFLAHHPDVTQKELADALGVIPASLSEVLMKLERKGLVERNKDENDRRMVRVKLTEKGQKHLEQPPETLSEPFQALSPEEQETLRQLLAKLLTDWKGRYVAERKKQGCRPHQECPDHDGGQPGHGSERPDHERNCGGRDDGCR